MKEFYRKLVAGTRKLDQAKEWVDYYKVTFFEGRARVYQADCPPRTDQLV